MLCKTPICLGVKHNHRFVTPELFGNFEWIVGDTTRMNEPLKDRVATESMNSSGLVEVHTP
jgi:hypothetical protein